MNYLVCWDGGATIIRGVGDPQSAMTLAKQDHAERKHFRVYRATHNDEKMVALSRPIEVRRRVKLELTPLPFTDSTFYRKELV